MTNKQRFLENKLYPAATIVIALCIWQIVVAAAKIPMYILPSPAAVVHALFDDFSLIASHAGVTLLESFLGFASSVVLAFILSVVMDNYAPVKKSLYPILIISQTVPIIALTPILIIWFGFGILTKVLVIILVCFFPITISLVDGFDSVDKEYMKLFRSLHATRLQIFVHLKLPYAMVNFFSGLKIAATYTIMAAVIGEWQGGIKGIGVYMVRAKKAYLLDKVFASILVIVIISVALIYVIDHISRKVTHWKKGEA